MANYCDRSNIEQIYGNVNVTKWADLDNDGDTKKIKNRIEWACEQSTEELNSRLKNGKYSVPFDDPPPRMITFMAALNAGLILSEGRSLVVDGSQPDSMSRARKRYKSLLRQLLSGQLKLLDPTTGEELDNTCPTHPQVFAEDSNCVYLVDGNTMCGPVKICATCNCDIHTCICRSISGRVF